MEPFALVGEGGWQEAYASLQSYRTELRERHRPQATIESSGARSQALATAFSPSRFTQKVRCCHKQCTLAPALDTSFERGFLTLEQTWHDYNLTSLRPDLVGRNA